MELKQVIAINLAQRRESMKFDPKVSQIENL